LLYGMIRSTEDHDLRARHQEVADSTVGIDSRAATDGAEVSYLKPVRRPDRRSKAEAQTLSDLDLP
jgi:hypothetical protein